MREDENATADERTDSLDRIALDLQHLRESAGPVSYAELVRRITDIRLHRGARPAAAAPARSTVYNAFRTARSRIDPELLHDIVTALGEDTESADAWVQRYRDVRRRQLPVSAPERSDAPPQTPQPAAPVRREISIPHTIGILCACVAINLVGLSLTAVFHLSVYLDMVGTAIAAIMLGPWHGVVVAIASSSLGFVTGDPHTVGFTPVNIVGALVWGFGVRRFSMGAGLGRFTILNVSTAVACSLVAAPLVAMMFHGGDGHASERSILALEAMHLPFIASVFSTNIVTSIVDKLLTGFLALIVFVVAHRLLGVPSEHMPLVEKLAALRTARASRVVRNASIRPRSRVVAH